MRCVILISTTRKGNKMNTTIKLTARETEALLDAIAAFENFVYDPEFNDRADLETKKALERIEAKLDSN